MQSIQTDLSPESDIKSPGHDCRGRSVLTRPTAYNEFRTTLALDLLICKLYIYISPQVMFLYS